MQCPELFADRLFRHNDATVMVCGPKSLGASVQELLPKAAKVARPEWKPHQVSIQCRVLHAPTTAVTGATLTDCDVLVVCFRRETNTCSE